MMFYSEQVHHHQEIHCLCFEAKQDLFWAAGVAKFNIRTVSSSNLFRCVD